MHSLILNWINTSQCISHVHMFITIWQNRKDLAFDNWSDVQDNSHRYSDSHLSSSLWFYDLESVPGKFNAVLALNMLLLIICYKIQAYIFILQHKKPDAPRLLIVGSMLCGKELAIKNNVLEALLHILLLYLDHS